MNQFAARGGKPRDELLKAGGDLRAAQEGLVSGDGDREAMIKARDRERVAVGGALEAVAALAADAGPELNAAAQERVRATLHAVALDDEVRAQFESARLTTDHEASGLGGGSTAGTGTPRKRSAAKKRGGNDRDAERKRRRREELKAAEADAVKRGHELDAAELQLREAKEAAKRAQGDLKRATKDHERAETAADKAAGKVADLRGD